MNLKTKLLIAILACALTVIAGRWALGLAKISELVHFSVNFPTEPGIEVMSLQELGGPWTRMPEAEWPGYPKGGLIAWGMENEIVFDIGKQGLIKRLVQHDYISISSHWTRNVGVKPYTIKLELDMCGLDLEWDTFEKYWDQKTQSSTRQIMPKQLFNMDWRIRIPEQMLDKKKICQGELRVLDAQTQQLLTALPIVIINSKGTK